MLFRSGLRSLGSGSLGPNPGPNPGLGLFSLFPGSRVPGPGSRLSTHCPRMRPRKRAPLLPMVGSLIRPMLAMRSSAMRSAAL